MTTLELLAALRSKDVGLWVEGEKLHYSAPVGGLTPALRAQLAERKAEILMFLREVHMGVRFNTPPLQPVSQDEELSPPLKESAAEKEVSVFASFSQQRLWFLEQWEPGIPAYNIPVAFRLIGSLNVTALRQSLSEVVRRHEALRTTFTVVEGKPVQVIAPSLTMILPVEDLQELPEPEREVTVRRRTTKEARRPFDLAQGPLVRATMLRLSREEHVLLLTMHHIVSDGWSMGILFRELSVLYEAFSGGKSSSLPELPIQYADFARWQQQWLQGEVLETQLTYWRRQLAGLLVLELPTDRPRPAARTFRGAQQSLVLRKTLGEALQTLSQREGVTLFMALLAAFQTLLHRYTGQDDIALGSPIANRTRAETEGLIGCLVNTLVLRTDLAGDPTFRELLGRVQEVALGAYAHQDLPFEKLVEELQPERNLSHAPLFQVLFVLQNAPTSALELPGLMVSRVRVDKGSAKFDLTLTLVEGTNGLRGTVEYNTDLFDAATITRLLGHFQTMLEGIVADPGQRLSALPLMTAAERQQLLVEWNDTMRAYPERQCLHQLFEAQVGQTPTAVAVVCEGQELTYRELNRRANQLAHHLRSLGVGPEVLVGLCVERSVEMVIGLLGILKTGGAYVPLDPTYPKDRLAFMLEDTQAPVLLTRQRMVIGLPQCRAQIVCLDSGWEVIAQESEENPVSTAQPENLAYVIYTSGSTGKPKGVLIEHRQILHYVQGIRDRCDMEPGTSFAMVQPLAVDTSQTVIFPSLIFGGCLHVISEDRASDPQALGEYFCRHPIDFLKIAPSHLAALQTSSYPEQLLPRRLLIMGGEASRQDWVERLQAMACCSIVNHYGPTETTVGVLTYRVQKDQNGHSSSTVPIGRPLPNTQAYLLDRRRQPVPVGIPGELHIGGGCVARGYLNQPELTADKFIPNPFSTEPAARLYKTGDLARYLPDGNIEFLGRTDHQVKIRGFRIELGEVEVTLGRHPAVREALVIAREDVPGEKRLVAYIVPHPGQVYTSSDLCDFLKGKLPDYMVPAAFVVLDALPLTPHGKVDRLALPTPDQARPELRESFAAPRTPVEKTLAEIWAEVLRLERVGVHDNFFQLGGDSILSIQIIARANQAGLRLTPKQLFQHQTVTELATAGTTPKVQVEQGPVTGAVPLTPIQRWFFEQHLPDPHHYNQAVLLEVRQALDPALVERALQQLLLHHDALRLRFVRVASGWQQINAGPDDAGPFSRVDLSALAEAGQEPALEAAAAELQASLNLMEGPLLRGALFDLGPQKPGRLLLVIHHLAIDGVSWRILLEDLWTAYRQLSRGEPIQLAPKTTSFKLWAERLADYAQSGALQRETTYWLSQSWTRSSRLPVDYPGGRNTVALARTVRVSLSTEETRALLQGVPAAYRTQINDVLLTALVQAFAQWTGARSLLIDLEGHGREVIEEAVDLSRTIGWFTTRFPVLLDLETPSRPGEALKSVKEQLRRIPNRGIGYGLLRYLSGDVAIAEGLRALPQPEVSFNYLGQFDQVLPVASPFAWARESSGPARSVQGSRHYPLAVNGCIIEGRLQLDWTSSENLHRGATIERVAQGFMDALRALIADSRSSETGGYTPSDFPEADLSQKELDEVIAELGELEE